MSSPVGGFFPIPLAMMIPFMATQSLVMGDAFGRSFQYGKRKISAMSNEEFNALTTEIIAEQIYKEYKNIIPNLKQSLVDSQDLQNKIIDELLALPSNALANLFANIANPNRQAEKEQTYSDPNNPEKDFAPPTNSAPYNPTPVKPEVTSRRDTPTTPPPVTKTPTADPVLRKMETNLATLKHQYDALNSTWHNFPTGRTANYTKAENIVRKNAMNTKRILKNREYTALAKIITSYKARNKL